MGNAISEATRRVAIELDRLAQEISVIRHVLDDAAPDCREEMVRRLGHVSIRATRIAAMVQNRADGDLAG